MNYDKTVFEDSRLEEQYQMIKRDLLKNKTPVEHPVAVVLGGLPGSGKGNIYKFYKAYPEISGNIVELDLDKFRKYHPDALSFSEEEFAAKTNAFVSAVVDRMIDEITPLGYNFITESALKRPRTAFQIAEELRPMGYTVELAVMATDYETAWQGTVARAEKARIKFAEDIANGVEYPDPPRPVPRSFFDEVAFGHDDIPGIEKSLNMIYEARNADGEPQVPVDDITIFTREGEILYNKVSTPDLDPTPILSARLHNTPEVAAKLIEDYRKASIPAADAALESMAANNDEYVKFLKFQGSMYRQSACIALEFFAQKPDAEFIATEQQWEKAGYHLKHGQLGVIHEYQDGTMQEFFDFSQISSDKKPVVWSLTSENVHAVKKALDLPENMDFTAGLLHKYLTAQDIINQMNAMHIPRSQAITFQTDYINSVRAIIAGRLEVGGNRFGVTADNTIFRTLTPEQQKKYLAACLHAARKALNEVEKAVISYAETERMKNDDIRRMEEADQREERTGSERGITGNSERTAEERTDILTDAENGRQSTDVGDNSGNSAGERNSEISGGNNEDSLEQTSELHVQPSERMLQPELPFTGADNGRTADRDLRSEMDGIHAEESRDRSGSNDDGSQVQDSSTQSGRGSGELQRDPVQSVRSGESETSSVRGNTEVGGSETVLRGEFSNEGRSSENENRISEGGTSAGNSDVLSRIETLKKLIADEESEMQQLMQNKEYAKVAQSASELDRFNRELEELSASIDPEIMAQQLPITFKSNPLEEAKQLIDDFCMKEYEGHADFSDLKNVSIAFTESEYGFSIQVTANLEDYTITTVANGKVVRTEEYASLEEMTSLALDYLNFDELVSLDHSEEEKALFEGNTSEFTLVSVKTGDEIKMFPVSGHGVDFEYIEDMVELEKQGISISVDYQYCTVGTGGSTGTLTPAQAEYLNDPFKLDYMMSEGKFDIIEEGTMTFENPEAIKREIASYITNSALSNDDWEDMCYPFFDKGYLEKHNPDERASYGWKRSISEAQLYEFARRMHDGEDIREEFGRSLMHSAGVTEDKEFVITDDGKFDGNVYGRNARRLQELLIEYGENTVTASYYDRITGDEKKYELTYEEIGENFLDRIKAEYEDLAYWWVHDLIQDAVPGISDKKIHELVDAFDGATLDGWERGDNVAKINRIKKALFSILGNEEQTDRVYTIIAKEKYNVQPVSKPNRSIQYQIWQLPDEEKYHGIMFESREQLYKDGIELSKDDYKLVYEDTLEGYAGMISLDTIFTKFNMDHPADYTGRSLSVSDVIVIKEENRQTAYYVDRIGYQKMPEFFAEKLQNEKITVQGFKTIEDMLDALKLSEETETEKVDTSVNMETNGYQVDTNSNLDTDGNDEIADITKEPEEDHADDLPEIVYAENPTRRLSDNIDAISTLKYIEANYGDGYVPNEYELRQFRKYAGWGGLAKVFDEDNHEFDMRRTQLKNLLTEDEYKAAKASTLNAHYTPQIVIDAMYKAIKEMELPRNARILEPACGTGNFITRLPASLSDAEVVGVELDSLTARLAHYINNGNINVSIINSAFENSGVEDNAYDLAIGNVPFGNYKLLDPDHANDDWFIHDAFFRKALDKVAPGGVVAFITSTGTLDKKNPKIREYLAERSDLIGAIRLPNNTFDDAGTKTASDIIFLQKRKEPRLKDDMPDWCYTMPNEDGLNINSYFVQNPQMILGKMEQTTHFNMLTCSPLPDADLSRQLDEAIRNLNAKIRVDKREKAVAERQSMIEPWGKNFTYQIKDNDVFYREGNTMHEVKCRTKAEKERLMLLCDIRSAARELIDLQSTSISDEELAPYRDKLNELYDRHKAKYGDLTSGKTNKLFSRDSDCAIVQSLEDINDNTNEHTKAAIFTERTVVPQTEITEAATLEDALQYSLDRKGKIDLIYMAELLKDVYQGDNVAGTVKDELIDKGYAFMDPDKIIAGEPYTGIVDSVEYLSGNVRQKLNTAMEYAENHPEYQRNVEALTKVIPEDIKIDEITVQMGCSWIDAEDYTKFLAHLSGRSAYSKFGEVSYSALTGEFTVTNSRARTGFNVNESQTYGTQNFSLYALAEKILNQRRIAVNIQVPNPKDPSKNVTRTDVKATKIANDVAKKIKQEFKKWIFADEARREKYERRYNNIFNSLVGRSYDGSKLTFPGLKSDFVLRSHQKNCVARTIYGGNTLAAHVVGAGKSAVIITSVMKKKELGLINKACVVVPKPLTEQTAAEWRKMYPGARLLTVTAADLNKEDKRKIFTAKVATGSYDAVIMSQEQFAKLQMTDEYRAEYIQKEIDELEENLREAKGQNGSRYSVKDIETKKKDLQNRLIKVTAPKSKTTEKDDLLDFENLGFDYLVVDEAHAYKNAFVITKMSDVAGVTTKPSDRAEDMQMKTDYFNEKFGQGHILFATGTPVSNSMTELYVMTRYLRPDLLKAQGIDRFDDWASTFGQVVTKNQQTSSGTLKLKTKFASFANLPELMAMYKEFADVQSAEKLNLPRPRLKDDKVQIIKAPATKEQKAYVKELADRALAYESGLVDSTKDNHLVITGEARLVGLGNMVLKSLYEKREKELPEDFIIEKNSKVDLCVEKVAELYNKTNETKGVQIIFSDIAVNSDDGNFSVYDYIKSELIEKGIPADEIIFAPKSDAKNREQIFADINSSKYRVVIASTSTLGTGANIQQNLYALHHVDIPWKPSDFTQREGRILRQGNNNPEVEIFNYVTEGTLDSYLYQTVTDKARFIAQLLDNNAPARVSEDCDEKVLTFAEIQAAAEGNPDFKRRIEISNEIAELTMLKGEYDRETAKTREQLKNYPGQIERYQTKLEKCKTDTATAKAFIGTDLTVKTHDGRTLTDKKEINSYIVGLAQKQRFAASSSPKFEVNDFTVNLSTREIDTNGMMFSDGPHVDFNIHGADTYTSEAGHVENSDNYIRLTNFFEKTLPGKIEKLEAAIAETENNMHQAEERIAAPFDHEEELEKLQTEFNELEEKLAGLSEQKDDFTDSDEIGVITPDEKKTDINELMDDEDDMSNSRRP